MSSNYSEHELALFIACRKFDEKYPRDTQPEWLKYCMSLDAARNERNNWVIKMLLSPKKELKANQYWHWNDNGVPDLIQVDPVTGEKSYIICNGPAPEPVTFFEVEVDVDRQAATILTDMDSNKLDGAKYMPYMCWDEHDQAMFIACKKFAEMYPKSMQPEWLKYCMYLNAARNERKNWIIKILLYPKIEIEANQYWRWMERSWEKRRFTRRNANSDIGYKKGVLILMQTDPVTGEECYVPWKSPVREPVTFFEVEVDIDKQTATVLTDMNPNKLDGMKYEMKISW